MAKNRKTTGTTGANRTRMKGAGSNLATVFGSKIRGYETTDIGGTSRQILTLDPFNAATNSEPITAIAGAYEFYRLVSSEVTFVPSGGMTQVGSITCAYVTNPEIMKSVISGSSTAQDVVLYNEQGVESFPLCERFTKRFQSSRQVSRQWFSCNYAKDETLEEIDRTIAALLIVRVGGLAGAALTPPGVMQFRNTYEFKGLGITSYATLAKISMLGDEEYRFNYSVQGEFPPAVVARKPNGTLMRYVKPPSEPKPDPKPE